MDELMPADRADSHLRLPTLMFVLLKIKKNPSVDTYIQFSIMENFHRRLEVNCSEKIDRKKGSP